MTSPFRMLMISAMYENGGNTTHRFLDGHPELYVYPFESQLGTRHVSDYMSSLFPVKYRWPVFLLDVDPEQDYHDIIDEECRVRARTPHVSKFRNADFDFSDDARQRAYEAYVSDLGRSRAANVEAFFRATFDVWTDCKKTGKESVYVGYSPIIAVDGDKILADIPDAHVLHIVRNPWSAYADTKKRPVPMSLDRYITTWNFCQHAALLYRKKFPARFHVVRIEDVLDNSERTLGKICEAIDVSPADSLNHVSWNGEELDEVYPWGTIRKAKPEANRATAEELDGSEVEEIRLRTWQYLDEFDYADFV